MQRLTRMLTLLLLVAVSVAGEQDAAVAKHGPPASCRNPSRYGSCVVEVRSPGHGHSEPGPGGQSGDQPCVDQGRPIPCTRDGLGSWDSELGCYLTLMTPQPPKSDPLWQGHNTGAIYICTTWPPRSTGTSEIWLPTPPSGADPRTLALRAEKILSLPRPTGDRSPSQNQIFNGDPFTYVNLWTWFWTSSATWQTRRATATAGGVSATVIVKPVVLLFDPGDGSSDVQCPGPGRPWTTADGDLRPTGGGCGYRYWSATRVPVISTQSIRWTVSWHSSDGESGTLPDLTTSRSGQLMVLQIESVATR